MAKLFRELITGNIFISEEISGRFKYIIAETNPDALLWEDMTSVLQFEHILTNHVEDSAFGIPMYLGKDYRYIRDEIKRCIELTGSTNTLSVEDDPSTLTPNSGDTYLIGTGATKEFVNKSGKVAEWTGSGWTFYKLSEYGFNFLSPTEKVIATKHKIGSHHQRLAALGGDVNLLVEIGLLYHATVGAVRLVRLGFAVSAMHNHTEHIVIELDATDPDLAPIDNSGLDVFNTPPVSPSGGTKVIVGYEPTGAFVGLEEYIVIWTGTEWSPVPRVFVTYPELALMLIDADNYIYKFQELGFGGLIDGDNGVGLFDWINATIGTKWAASGLRVMPWTPEGLNNFSEFADKLLDILQNGNYYNES